MTLVHGYGFIWQGESYVYNTIEGAESAARCGWRAVCTLWMDDIPGIQCTY